jgi:UDP:flavonoid glycosyltransferase YjiC (YdhE family)
MDLSVYMVNKSYQDFPIDLIKTSETFTMGSIKTPFVIAAAMPFSGHVVPIRAIAGNLVERGYDVTMVTGSSFGAKIEELGISFEPITGYGDFIEEDFDTRFAERANYEGPAKMIYDMEHIFAKSMPSQHAAIQKVLKEKKEQDPDRSTVAIYDWLFFGLLPSLCGAPGIRPTGAVVIGTSILDLPGPGVFPLGTGILPDYSEEGKLKAEEVNKLAVAALALPSSVFYNLFRELGATPKAESMLREPILSTDRYIHTSLPEVEYPRSNMPAHIMFCGGLPKQKMPKISKWPIWWDEITTNPNNATIVMVSQSTLANDLHDIAGPTLQALKDRPNTIVILNLSTPDQVVPEDIEIPTNTRVGYVLFDEILPYCDAWVLNFGYGAFQHGITNAVPMVGSGHTEDRADVAARAEWTGIAVNLRNGITPPTPEVVKDAVEEVLKNPKYKKRVTELSIKAKDYDVYGIIAKTIDTLGSGTFEKLNDQLAANYQAR